MLHSSSASFEIDLLSRLKALGVDQTVQALVRSLQQEIAHKGRDSLEKYYRSWLDLTFFQDQAENRIHNTARIQSEFYTALFSGEMNEGYINKLRATLDHEAQSGFGSRIHLAALAAVAKVAFEAIGRRARWSGRQAAAQCESVLRYLIVDALNAIHIEQTRREQELTEKQGALQNATATFSETAGVVQTSLQKASDALRETARNSIDATKMATEAVGRAEFAAERSAQDILLNATTSRLVSKSNAGVAELTREAGLATNQVFQSVQQLATTLAGLANRTQEIDRVVGLISTVAKQTNLLALNAAIEAARAGGAGAGFAVVADEVKTLASQTAIAVESISAQIAEIQDESRGAAERIQCIVETIEYVSSIASSASAAISEQAEASAEIADRADNTALVVGSIDDASSQVRAAMLNLADSATDISAWSNELSFNACELNNSLVVFLKSLRLA